MQHHFDVTIATKYGMALEEEELINTACLNSNPYDRTKWYTITNKGLALFNTEDSMPGNKEETNA